MSNNTACEVKNERPQDRAKRSVAKAAKDANYKVMELWQHITNFTDQNACNSSPSQWNFRYLEITGQRCEIPNIDEICKRIPKLKIDSRTRYVKPRVESKLEINFRHTPPKRAIRSPPKPLKENVVSVKVVVPKPRDEDLSRNCICTCGSQEDTAGNTNIEDDEDDISCRELLDIILKYDQGIRKNGSYVIINLVRRFRGNTLLDEEGVKKVLRMLDSNNQTVQECLMMLINHLSRSSATARLLLQNGVLDDLIYLMLMGTTEDVQIQAAGCIAKLTEREELSDLWIETMVISGTEALFDVLSADQETVSESLRNAILDAVSNLSSNLKMATMLINRFDLSSITDLTRCKTDEGKPLGSPVTQRLATKVLTSLLSHNCAIVEQFLSKYDEAVGRVVDILQYCACPQQQEAARFLSMLTLFKPGLDPAISHHAIEHLLWAMTCSHCRFVRESTSKAFKNLTQHSEKDKLLRALEQFSMAQIDQPFDAEKELDSLLKAQPFSSKIIGDIKRHSSISKLEKTMVEIFSVLSVSFQTDSLHLCGSNRKFMNDNHVKGTGNNKGIATKNINEQYLSSLRVLTNTLVAMAALMRLKDRDENDIACSLGTGPNLSLAALFVQCGGLQFLDQLQFLSNKLQKINPPNFHGIDPTTLPPKEIIYSIKNTRTELIFNASGKKQKPKNRYPDFGLHSTELEFIRQCIGLLVILAQATTEDFDPSQEDVTVFLNSRPPPKLSKKRRIYFQTSALVVKNVVKMNGSISPRGGEDRETNETGCKKPFKRQHSVRSLSSRMSLTSMDRRSTTTSQGPKLPPTPTTVEHGASSSNEMIHYVKQSLLGFNVVSILAVWVTCGIYDVQTDVMKVLRYLMHAQNVPKRGNSDQTPSGQPQEAWTTNTRKPSIPARPSQRSSVSSISKPKNKSIHLSHLCVRHVIQNCGTYLLDLLEPPASGVLGRMSLMVMREAIINGENDSRLKFVKLGCFARVIDYIRGTEDEPEIQSLGLLVLRNLVSSDQALKQLFLAHGGMSLVMALHEYKEGLVKDEAAYTLKTFSKASTNTGSKARGLAAHSKKRFKTQSSDDDIWDHVAKKWQSQDKVAKLLTKFNVRY